MKAHILLGTVLLSASLFSACSKSEKDLMPSGIAEMAPQIPQGNNNYDDRIVEYHDRWGSYLLYKFSKPEFSWQVTGMDSYYVGVGADPAYISDQLDLLEDTFFKYYQDSTLRRYLPIKFMLCSSLTHHGSRVDALMLNSTAMAGYETFAVNWGNSRIREINNPIDSTSIFRANVNYSFLKMMRTKNHSGTSDIFMSVSSYTPLAWGAPDLVYGRGFLANGLTWAGTANNFNEDWDSFLKAIIYNPYSYLTDGDTTPSDPSAKGILSSVKDTSGLIRRKYDAMIDYYKTNYNIDLQRIGNGE